MSFGFYILVAIDLQRPTSGETGLKYLLPGALSAAFLAFGIALLYCVSGTLALAETVQMTLTSSPNPIALAGWACLLAGIAFKLSLAPAHLWTPDVYQGAPAPVTAFLSAGSKGATILLFLLLLPQRSIRTLLRVPLWGLAFFSCSSVTSPPCCRVASAACWLTPPSPRWAMSSSPSSPARAAAIAAAAYYAIAYGVISLAAFGAIVVLERNGAGESLDDYRGLGQRQPFAAGVLTLALLALAGIPPTAGFTGKFLIFAAALRAGEIALAVIGILLAAVSIYYYLRVVVVLYFKECDARG